jgi:hypothetical protein
MTVSFPSKDMAFVLIGLRKIPGVDQIIQDPFYIIGHVGHVGSP